MTGQIPTPKNVAANLKATGACRQDALASLAEMGRRYRDRMKAAQEGASDNP